MKKFLSVFSNGPTSSSSSSSSTEATTTTTSSTSSGDASSSSSSNNKTSIPVKESEPKESKVSSASSSSPTPSGLDSKDSEEKNIIKEASENLEHVEPKQQQPTSSTAESVAATDDSVTSRETSMEEGNSQETEKITSTITTSSAADNESKECSTKVSDEQTTSNNKTSTSEEVTSSSSVTDGNCVSSSSSKKKKVKTSNSGSEVTSSEDSTTKTTSSASPTTTSSYSKELQQYDLPERIFSRLSSLFDSNKLSMKDLDKRAMDAIKEYGNKEGMIAILDEFEASSLEHVNNKSAFLCGLMKTHRQKEKALMSSSSLSSGKDSSSSNHPVTSSTSANNGPNAASASGKLTPSPGPDESKLKAILERTGYTLDVTSGQRKYGGPPPDWSEGSNPPGPGCEIFVGKIPNEVFEDELIPLFEEVGRIWDLRLMIDPISGFNRGFAFITYCNRDDASAAQLKFEGYEIRKGKTLKVNVSVPNLRLFVGNIPKSKSREEILAEFAKVTVGLVEVIVYSSPDDRKKNRGFCFLEYDSHKSASLAKRKLSTSRQKFWGCDILVDWADPQEEPDEETMSKVKVLYVSNLVSTVTEDDLRQTFGQHGTVERVKKIKDYAFVHFEDRDQAEAAMNQLNHSEMQGVKMSVSLAKPPSDRRKKEEVMRNRERRVAQMMQERARLNLGPVVAAAAMAAGLPTLPFPPLHLSPSLPAHHVHHATAASVNPHQPGSTTHHLQGLAGNPAQVTSPSMVSGALNAGQNVMLTTGRRERGSHRTSGGGQSQSSTSYSVPGGSQVTAHHPYGRHQVPSYQQQATGWYPPDWTNYPIYPTNWIFDPRSGQSHPTTLPAGHHPTTSAYPRGVNVNNPAAAALAAVASSANNRNNRSLWTPNGNVSSNMTNGPQVQSFDNKSTSLSSGVNKNWSNSNRRNSRSDGKSGGGSGNNNGGEGR